MCSISELIEERAGSGCRIAQAADWTEFQGATYQIRVLLSPEADGGFSARAIRLPGVISEGETQDEALANIKDAFQAVAQEYLAAGAIPWCDDAIERPSGSVERWILVDV